MQSPLFDSLEPVVRAAGHQLWWVDWIDRKTLQVCIDSPDGITLEDCETVSRQVSAWLDVADKELGLPASYNLQVSSPGADRKLHTREHYQCYCGQQVAARLNQARDGRRRFSGRLVEVGETGIVLETADQSSDSRSTGIVSRSIGWDEIKETRLVYDPHTDLHR